MTRRRPRCPYCLDDLQPDQETVRCGDCRTPHHAPCFQENGGCVSYGCSGAEQVQAGLSLFARPSIQLHHQVRETTALGPFALGCKRLAPIPEQRPSWRCPDPYTRLSLESGEVREGERVRGRAVVYVPRDTTYRRIDLHLFQGIARPSHVGRVSLTGPRGVLEGQRTLAPGSHPFYLELQAPPTTPPVDPFLLELVLVRGLFQELRSSRLCLYLLQGRHDLPEHHAMVRRPEGGAHPAIRIAPREAPAPNGASAEPAPPAPLAPAGGGDPFAPAGAPPPRPFAPGRDPFADEVDPFGVSGQPAGGWTDLPLAAAAGVFDSGERVGRSLPARFAPTPGPAEGQVHLQVPSMPVSRELPITVFGGGRLASMSLAVHYELVRPGGGEVDHPGFPALEEARLLGDGALDARRYGPEEGLELRFTVPRERLDALARARADGAHNAALRLRLAVDAIGPDGRVFTAPARTVTFTAPA